MNGVGSPHCANAGSGLVGDAREDPQHAVRAEDPEVICPLGEQQVIGEQQVNISRRIVESPRMIGN
jgi:hypothetical protein